MTKTRLNVVLIEEGKDDKKFFTNIGAAFQHEDGNGYDLNLKCQPFDGKFSCFLASEDEPDMEIEGLSHMNALVVDSKKNDMDEWENYYTKVGVAFPHKRGFNVQLVANPVAGKKLVLRTPKD